MIRKTLFAAILAVSTTPAFAFQCPGDMAKIDAALQTAQLSDADKAKVMELRAKGEELHSAGQHQESVDTLAEALKILGM
jgi:hypothetical protein